MICQVFVTCQQKASRQPTELSLSDCHSCSKLRVGKCFTTVSWPAKLSMSLFCWDWTKERERERKRAREGEKVSELFGEVKKDFSQKVGSTRVWLCTNVHAAGTRLIKYCQKTGLWLGRQLVKFPSGYRKVLWCWFKCFVLCSAFGGECRTLCSNRPLAIFLYLSTVQNHLQFLSHVVKCWNLESFFKRWNTKCGFQRKLQIIHYNYLFTYLFTYLLIYLFIDLLTYLITYYLFIYFTYLLVYLFIYLLTYLFT
jgi:hypothetical protein